jgi:hypothetical protein
MWRLLLLLGVLVAASRRACRRASIVGDSSALT